MHFTRLLINCPCGPNHTLMVNGLSGAIDLVDNLTFELIRGYISNPATSTLPKRVIKALKSRGYLFTSETEETAFLESIKSEYLAACVQEQSSFWICPTYRCNLRCTYCFEGETRGNQVIMSEEQITAAFAAMKILNTTGKTPMFHLYGGEPLLPETYEAVASIMDKAVTAQYPINIVTNGTNIPLFMPLLAKYRDSLNFVQITLDGIREIHDQQRIYNDGRGSFNEIVQGIDLLIANHIPVQIRTNLDMEGLDRFGEFIRFIEQKGWRSGPNLFFYFTTVNNRHCGKIDNCPTELDAAKLVVRLRKDCPEANQWHDFDMFQVLDTLMINLGYVSLRSIQPKFHQCNANWNRLQVFCPDNQIYPCPSAVGDTALSIGTFAPELKLEDAKMALWQYGSVDELERCAKCPSMLLCGGGCTLKTIRMQGQSDCHHSIPLIKSAVRELSQVILEKFA